MTHISSGFTSSSCRYVLIYATDYRIVGIPVSWIPVTVPNLHCVRMVGRPVSPSRDVIFVTWLSHAIISWSTGQPRSPHSCFSDSWKLVKKCKADLVLLMLGLSVLRSFVIAYSEDPFNYDMNDLGQFPFLSIRRNDVNSSSRDRPRLVLSRHSTRVARNHCCTLYSCVFISF